MTGTSTLCHAERDSLVDVFESWSGQTGTFVVWDDGYRTHEWSYAEIASAARNFAANLTERGARRVLIRGENRPGWLIALWGTLLSGAVAVPVDARSSPELTARIARAAEADVLLDGDAALAELEESARSPSRVGIAGESTGAGELAEILFTSGTTAEPKGVLITHANILANIRPVGEEVQKYVAKYRLATHVFFPIRFLNLLPLSHMFGQAMATFIPPMIGGEVHFLSAIAPDRITDTIRKRRVSVLVCVPRMLEVLREHILARFPEAGETMQGGPAARWWRYRHVHRYFGFKFWAFVVGAAPLPVEVEQFWRNLGFVVIQGYGLTETAPIVTLNHPFRVSSGTVGKPIGGVEVRLSEAGEVLVRGANVTAGYLGADSPVDAEGWLHTGDAGEFDDKGNLRIRGRLKEMIVTPDGTNVFPEDVERVLDGIPGVRESAIVGRDSVHAVLVVDPEVEPEAVVRAANDRLEVHQRIRAFTVWTDGALPRTEGTGKLLRREVATRITGAAPGAAAARGSVAAILARHAPGRTLDSQTTLEQLGLSSLERVEVMAEIERELGASVDEHAWTQASSVADLETLLRAPQAPAEDFAFPAWNRGILARSIRRTSLPTWILPLARVFSRVRAGGLENLRGLEPPVIFAANHQSHLDVPSILAALPAKWRYRLSPAMSKEFFDAHFHADRHSTREWLTNSLNYYLAALLFQAFPLPQREAGARRALRYAGEVASEGGCVLIFPEGRITDTGAIAPFQAGVGMLAVKLGLPVVPVRIAGLDRVLHRTWHFPRPGRVLISFGKPLRFAPDAAYGEVAAAVQRAVQALPESP